MFVNKMKALLSCQKHNHRSAEMKRKLLILEEHNHRHRLQKFKNVGFCNMVCRWQLFFFIFISTVIFFYSEIQDEEKVGFEVEVKFPLPMMRNDIGEKDKKYLPCIADRNIPNNNDAINNDGYLVINANGGLNQMRIGICDMVAIAKMMNASLVIPSMDGTTYWNDQSEFKDIFDVDHFIQTLQDEVQVVESLPYEYSSIKPLKQPPISYSKSDYYEKKMKELLKERKVVEFTHADSRLANNDIPPYYQKLRCFANYEALRFTEEIYDVGEMVFQRLMRRSNGKGYIAFHLRYEKDMLSFTGCNHNLTKWEAEELDDMRRRNKRWKEKKINGEKKRKEGKCPMSPRETVLFLKAMGFQPNTHIYIVAGELYGANSIKTITSEFPNLHTHQSVLAGTDQLKKFNKYQNRMAAVDYHVAVKSDVFIFSYNGNMAKAVQGYRRFHGFLPTINPDIRMIIHLIDRLDNGEFSWNEFASKVQSSHPPERLGAAYERKPGKIPKLEENFYANPFPDCFCYSNSSIQTIWD